MESTLPRDFKQFSTPDYIVFTVMMGVSVMIGFYFGFFKKKDTVIDYLLGSKSLQLFPVILSLVSSNVSGVTLLGYPTEMYKYGTQWSVMLIVYVFATAINAYVFTPMFFKLELVSLYKYLEMRFNKAVRILCSLIYTIEYILFSPLVIYGPAIVLNQVSGFEILPTALAMSIICILYTTLGGLKAVVWTDTFQCLFMVLASLVIMGLGLKKVGGLSNVFAAAEEGDRLQFFNMSINPQERTTFWIVLINGTLNFISYTGVNPSAIQRLSSLPSFRKARLSMIGMGIGIAFFTSISMLFGLVIYTRYQTCDLIGAKYIRRDDQLLPFFVMDVAGHLKGLPGLFVVGVCSAAMSSLSTSLNTLSATIYEDFVLPLLPKEMNESHSSLIIKGITVSIGVTCLILMGFYDNMDTLVSLTYTLGGITSGATLSVFLMATLCPTATSKGAFAGGVTSLLCMLSLTLGNMFVKSRGLIVSSTKPMRTEGCSNFTAITADVIPQGVNEMGSILEVFKVTIFLYTTLGTIIGLSVGLAVTHLTGPHKLGDVHPDLLSHVVHWRLPKECFSQDSIKMKMQRLASEVPDHRTDSTE